MVSNSSATLMEAANVDINKLVSLTFDESPKIRKEAAKNVALPVSFVRPYARHWRLR